MLSHRSVPRMPGQDSATVSLRTLEPRGAVRGPAADVQQCVLPEEVQQGMDYDYL